MTQVICIIFGSLGLLGILFGAYCGQKLRAWEGHITRTRITIAYKNKVKINAPILEWLQWAQSVEKDEQVRGRAVYKMGGTTVAILKKVPKSHGQTSTTTVEQSPNDRAREAA